MSYENIELKHISVLEPVGDAIRVMKRVLFDPFNLEKWFLIGLCAFLSQLGSGGSFNMSGGEEFSAGEFENAKTFFFEHMTAIITIGTTVFLFLIALGLVFSWLSSRGQFMFLDCIVRNYGGIKTPWTEYKHEGNSLFVFRIWFSLAMFAFVLLNVGLIVGAFFYLGESIDELSDPVIFIALIVWLFFFLIILLSALVILQFTYDFVVPIMYIYRVKYGEAWRILWSLIKNDNVGKFIWYHIFKSFLMIGIGIILMLTVLLTCIGCCLVMIPYISSVFLLPFTVFTKAYSFCYLRQYGSSYDVYSVLVYPEDQSPEEFSQPEQYGNTITDEQETDYPAVLSPDEPDQQDNDNQPPTEPEDDDTI